MESKVGKPQPPKSALKYFFQACHEEFERKHPNEYRTKAESMSKCSERWKTMDENLKRRFYCMSREDKKRYNKEMCAYRKTEAGNKSHGKKSKDSNAPKRYLSAFFWFCHDERAKIEAELKTKNAVLVSKELGRKWNSYPIDQKKKYEILSAKDKARYKKELVAYKTGTSNAELSTMTEPEKDLFNEKDDVKKEDEDKMDDNYEGECFDQMEISDEMKFNCNEYDEEKESDTEVEDNDDEEYVPTTGVEGEENSDNENSDDEEGIEDENNNEEEDDDKTEIADDEEFNDEEYSEEDENKIEIKDDDDEEYVPDMEVEDGQESSDEESFDEEDDDETEIDEEEIDDEESDDDEDWI